ncbi:DctP family TRAP transporter solute-binding subunit [Brenneria tiliae]|uniref:DctP family TRAP transporter solute-binding subunit n=1 Tax=Brenneria tiliae TaxID=2914984 RepID=A0ABT0N0H2_9GAMM|nr:DctP family TRAP transporter solute-binding subunit [Brenneria tiliae]MCL2895600.1 DctP family TRAP transporter solute-binding subunit [Brenneria tiliae]
MKSNHKVAALIVSALLFSWHANAIELKLGHVLPTSHNWNIAASGFADDVQKQTDGRVSIKLFPNGQLGNEKNLVEGLQIGSLQAGIIGCGSLQPIDAKFGIVELPYSWPNRQAAYAAYDGELGNKLETLAEKYHLKILSWWENGYRHVTNNRAPIASPDDLAGLKIRVTPDKMRLDSFTALGASPAPLAFGELYSALQQRVFDAQENPLSIIDSSSLFEVQKYLSLTGHVWAPACLVMSESSWKRISPQDQARLQALADKWRDEQRRLTRQDDKDLIDKLQEKGMQINEVDPKPFAARVQSVWQTYQQVFGPELIDEVKRYSAQ